MMVSIAVMAPAPAAPADDGPIATTAGASLDCRGGDWGEMAQDGGERSDQTAKCRPA
jgi:hypothetical protein